jgi:uncharacterized protein (DUF2344 family)
MASGTDKVEALISTYSVVSNKEIFNQKQMDSCMEKPEWIISKTSRKGKIREINLRPSVLELERVSPSELRVTLRTSPGHVVRPRDVVTYLFEIFPEDLKSLQVTKVNNRIESATGSCDFCEDLCLAPAKSSC